MSARRVAITGMGAVVPGGLGIKAFWELITAGRTATRRISFFDPAPFRSRSPPSVTLTRLTRVLSPQQVRRMDRAAQFAVVSARGSLADSGMSLADLDPARTGVTIGSAVGCTMGLEEEYSVVSDGGRHWLVDNDYTVPHLFGYFVPSSIAVEVAWKTAARGTCRGRLDRLHLRDRRGRSCRRAHRRRLGRRDDRRRDGRADLADHDGLLRRDQGDHAKERRARARVPAVRPRRGTDSCSARARRSSCSRSSGMRRRRGARVYAEIAGLRHAVQRLSHDRPAARRPGDGGGDRRGAHTGKKGAAGGGLRKRARLRHKAERPARDGGVQARPGQARLHDPGQLDQVDDRPFARRHRVAGDRGLRACDRRRGSSRLPPTCTSQIPSATWTTSRPGQGGPGRHGADASAAASAASRARWC